MIGTTHADKTQASKIKKQLLSQNSSQDIHHRRDSKTEFNLPSIVFSSKNELSAQRSPVNVLASTLASSNVLFNNVPFFNTLPNHPAFSERFMTMLANYEPDSPTNDIRRLKSEHFESPITYSNVIPRGKNSKYRQNSSLSTTKSSILKGTSPKSQFLVKVNRDDFSRSLYGQGSMDAKKHSKIVNKLKEMADKKETDEEKTQIRDYKHSPTAPMSATIRKQAKSKTVVAKIEKIASPPPKNVHALDSQPEIQDQKSNPTLSTRILIKAPTEDPTLPQFIPKESKVAKLRSIVHHNPQSSDEELKTEEPPEKHLLVKASNPTSLPSTAELTHPSPTNPDTPSNRGFENSGNNTPKDKTNLNTSMESATNPTKSRANTHRKSHLATSTAPTNEREDRPVAHISFHSSEKDSQMTRPSNHEEITTKSRKDGATYIRILTDKSDEPLVSPGISTGKETKAAQDSSLNSDENNASPRKFPEVKFQLPRKSTADAVLDEKEREEDMKMSDSSEDMSPVSRMRRPFSGVPTLNDRGIDKRQTYFLKRKTPRMLSRSFESLDKRDVRNDLEQESKNALSKINFKKKGENRTFKFDSPRKKTMPVMDLTDKQDELLQKMDEITTAYFRERLFQLEENFFAKEAEKMKTIDFSTLLRVEDDNSSKYHSRVLVDSRSLDPPKSQEVPSTKKIFVNIIPPIMEESVRYETDTPMHKFSNAPKQFEFTIEKFHFERGGSLNEVEGDFKRLRSIEELDEVAVNSRVLFGDSSPIAKNFDWGDDEYFNRLNGQRDFLMYYEELCKMNRKLDMPTHHIEEKFSKVERNIMGDPKIDRRDLNLYIDTNPTFVPDIREEGLEDSDTNFYIDQFVKNIKDDMRRSAYDISESENRSSKKFIFDEAKYEPELQRSGKTFGQPILSSHMPYVQNTYHAIMSLKDAKYQMSIFLSNKNNLYEYLTIHSLNLQKIKLVDPMIKISKIINKAKPENMDFIKNLIIQGYYSILEGTFQSHTKVKKIEIEDPHKNDDHHSSKNSPILKHYRRSKKKKLDSPKNQHDDAINTLVIPKSKLSPYSQSNNGTPNGGNDQRQNLGVIQLDYNNNKPNTSSVNIVITSPGRAPVNQSGLPEDIIPSRKGSACLTKDSSFKSKPSEDLKTADRSEIKNNGDMDITQLVRRKTPVVPDKVKNSRRGAETLDIKDIQEIHNTFTRRTLIEASRIQDVNSSPVNVNRKGDKTNKNSPGGQLARIMLDTFRKYDEEKPHDSQHNNPITPSHQNILSGSNGVTSPQHHNKMTLSMKSELKSQNKMDKNALLMRIHSHSYVKKQNKHPLMQMFQCVLENRAEPLLELLRSYQIISVDLADEHGNHMLCIASQCGFYDIVKILLERGANPNIQNAEGNTSLHLAMAYGHSDIADILIQNGAHQNVLNHNGKTPWELAQS